MMLQIFSILAMCYGALSAPTGDCAGGYKTGEVIERGYYVYECQSGEIVPKGCLSDDQRRLAIGETQDRKNYRLKCQLDGQSGLSLSAFACLHSNQEHPTGQEWQDEKNFYTCKQDGKALRIETLGCVHQGKRVPLKEKTVDGEFVFTCAPTVNNSTRLEVTGCSSEGKQVNVGESFEAKDFFYNCTRFGVRPAGCIHEGKRLNDGDRYHQNDVIYECTIENKKTEVIATGCAQKDTSGTVIERRLGCYFVDGPEPQQFEFNCKHDKASNKATKIKIRCNYRVGKGVYQIEPGCYRAIDDKLVGCSKDASGDLKYDVFGKDQATQATGAGLRSC